MVFVYGLFIHANVYRSNAKDPCSSNDFCSSCSHAGSDVDKEEGNTNIPGNRKITLLIIFTAIGSVISGAALLPSYDLSQVAAQQVGSDADLSLSMLRQHGAPLLGSPSARITIIEFGDFQCPFCKRFAKDTEPQINQTYIQTGKVNMVFVHFTKFGPDSITAAVAGQCVNDQGKFWNLYEILYKNQGAEDSGWASKDNQKKFALQIPAVNPQKFNTCLDSGKNVSLVQSVVAFRYEPDG